MRNRNKVQSKEVRNPTSMCAPLKPSDGRLCKSALEGMHVLCFSKKLISVQTDRLVFHFFGLVL